MKLKLSTHLRDKIKERLEVNDKKHLTSFVKKEIRQGKKLTPLQTSIIRGPWIDRKFILSGNRVWVLNQRTNKVITFLTLSPRTLELIKNPDLIKTKGDLLRRYYQREELKREIHH